MFYIFKMHLTMLWALKTFTFDMNTICFAVLATQYFLPPERLVPSCGWGQGSEDTDGKQMTRQSQAPCLLLQAQCSQNHTATVKPRKIRMRLMKTLFGEVGKQKSNPQMAVSRGCFWSWGMTLKGPCTSNPIGSLSQLPIWLPVSHEI